MNDEASSITHHRANNTWWVQSTDSSKNFRVMRESS